MPVWHVARAPAGAVFIGRPSRWGNPYVLKREADRTAVLAQYRAYLWREIQSGRIALDELAALDGADLACYCAPRACHGDVLTAAARWAAGRVLVRIEAPHFVAGVDVERGRVVLAAPILHYALGWGGRRLVDYCARKGWTYAVVSNGVSNDPAAPSNDGR